MGHHAGPQITGPDAERGFKRLCNPVQPSGGIGYYVGVIVGMKEFCDPFAKVAAEREGDRRLRRGPRGLRHHLDRRHGHHQAGPAGR